MDIETGVKIYPNLHVRAQTHKPLILVLPCLDFVILQLFQVWSYFLLILVT